MTPDEWEISAENVDIGGCSLENPMDIIPTSYEALYEGELPEMDISNDLPAEPGEVSHVGFISEIEEGGIASEGNGMESLLQADRVVEHVEISFAKRATQVDVQKLKACD